MAKFTFDASGVDRLAADLAKGAAEFDPRASLVLRKTALDIEADAKTFAPVDTGALKSSISSDIGEFSAEIGPTVDYAHYVEGGTSRMAPQPYMAPAADRRVPEFVRALRQLTERIL